MRKPEHLIILLLIILSPTIAYAQNAEDWAFHIRGGAEIPVGDRSALFVEDATWLTGGGASLSAQYIFPNFRLMYMEANIGVGIEPSQADILTLGSAGMGFGLDFRVADRLSMQLGSDVGYAMGLYQDESPAFNSVFRR